MKYLILHHSAVSRVTTPNQFWAINNYHKKKWNMKSCKGYYHGYTHYLGTNGVITQARCMDDEGAHTTGYNKGGHIALCIAGNFNIEYPNEKQIKSLKQFIDSNERYQVMFHSELQDNRTCPGILFTRDYFNDLWIDEEDENKQKEIQKLQGVLIILLKQLQSLLEQILRLKG